MQGHTHIKAHKHVFTHINLHTHCIEMHVPKNSYNTFLSLPQCCHQMAAILDHRSDDTGAKQFHT